ncbi:MAG: rhomboid family intramembrane serine protease [Paludibacter sp.]|nr:rhomboid family intramembrane serine protease [Paludibacter sp.]
MEKKRFLLAIFFPMILSVFMVLVFVLEKGMGWDFHRAGIYPRHIGSIYGILTYGFIHAGIGHLLNNLLSFFILSTCVYFFYREIANPVMLSSYLLSGIILWIIGRDSWHIGASGWIYALASFLFFSGIFRKHIPLIAISLVVTFLYGSMVWHLFPWTVDDPVSWEGHFAGAVTGLILSVLFRKYGPQKPVKNWEDEEDDNEEDNDWQRENL